ncbi:Structural maintenance of chromosomes protein 1A [Echinococcus granulosus]|uniref:Structural maintenance of chromosomes protein n=1 Tax=Echinococcus granulosus TaxID=6210 RepID=A0A068WB35_ECHGR|nr:Structural maintenance of chromosomes protein 1A [Echinococcus granulosus]CDS15626.1 structural maintenance of chromosomes protein [Echinococcus granulosus]
MDAISFVLGERTRHLRVTKLSDLIHGSVVGKPVAKTASVTAVYQMPDGVDKRFSRYISGNTSEYRINGTPVKVEEYAEALEKIRIFMKVKNFLIFQGAVESIAMKNARERCQMFEEISRSAEYKEEYDRSKAEMQKLEEEATFNLNKKKNIVAERKEARIEIDEAEKYKKLHHKWLSKRTELQLFRLYYNDVDIKRIREDLQQREEIIEQENTQRQQIEEEIRDKRRELGKLHRDQAGLEQEIKKCDQKVSKRKPEYIKVSQMLRHVSDKHKESKKALENARQQHSSHRQEMDQLEAEYSRILALKEDYEHQQNKKSKEQGRSLELEDSQLAEYHRLKQKAAEHTSDLSAQLDALRREYDEQKDLFDGLERRKEEIENSLRLKQTELIDNQRRLQRLVEFIETSHRSITELSEAEKTIREEVESATRRMDEINAELETVICQLGEAKVERHESSRAVKKQELIENLKRLFPGVHGRLLEMCEPSHKRYQIAITKVLGKHMDSIVCDSEKTAKDCIQYMKDQRIEPETFLPLDFLDVKPVDEKLREINEPPNVHLVIDVINCDPVIAKKALQFACGNALVCDTVEHARYVAYNMGDRKKTVSLDGTLFQRSGIISGGASDLKARAKRWDEKQISSLMARRDALQVELKEQLKRKRKEAELRTLQSQINGLEKRLKYTQKDKEGTEEKILSGNEEEVNNLKVNLEEVNERLSMCQTKMQELQISINAEKAKMDNVEDTVLHDFCVSIGVENIREYEDRELRIARERDRKRMEFTNQLQRINNQLEYEKSRDTQAAVRRWEEAVVSERQEMERCKKQEKRLKEEMEAEEIHKGNFEFQLSEYQRKCERLDGELAELSRRLVSRKREIQKLQKETSQIETRLEAKRSERHSLLQSAKMEDLQLPLKPGASSMPELESQLSAESEGADLNSEEMMRLYVMEARLPLDYKQLEKPLRMIADDKEVSRKVDEMQAEVDRMQSELSRFQAPNLKAGAKLGNVEQRLRSTEAEFEETRRKAKKARAQFERIRRLRCNAFMKCFLSIADNIDPLYKALSRNPGAQASLLPTNAEEPYLEELQFQCVAPGKRFQQMDSLSGGEKTIAALALSFAMHQYNPSPFFVLDEIDAALDNTNIGKVASFIREYSRTRAQVIVISLKEEFYSRADSLVGIYPDTENNCLVSRVLTFDLSKYVDTEE